MPFVLFASSISPALAASTAEREGVLGETLSSGGSHTCAVTYADAIRCWGGNAEGQATFPLNLGKVTEVSSGGSHTCALTAAGAVRCRGLNDNGQATVPLNLGAITHVSAGYQHTCALTAAGAVRCWGNNWDNQGSVPSNLGVVTQVSAGGSHTCALTAAGAVRCWGNNRDNQGSVPSNLGVVTQVSAGYFHTCAVTAAGAVRCWGNNGFGQSNVPSNLGVVTQVSAGDSHTCAVTAVGAVRCWGYNGFGQSNVPSNLGVVTQVSAGGSHTCALTAAGAVRCWGNNGQGQATVPSIPTEVSQVSAGYQHTCALTASGSVRCWGNSNSGRSTVPSNLGVITQVSAGGIHTCAVTAVGAVRCWGNSYSGQATVPSNLGVVTQVSAGYDHTCALTASGVVRCWGYNLFGQATVPSDLGVVTQVSAGGQHTCALTASGVVRCWGNSSSGRSTIPSNLGAITQVSAGGDHTCAVTASGVVRCWGDSSFGQSTVSSNLGVITQVSAGGDHTCAVTASGLVRCWGDNGDAQVTVPTEAYESGVYVVFKQASGQQIGAIEGSISGSLMPGSVAEAQFALDGEGTLYYQWFRNGVEITSATQKTYRITEQDIGTNLTATLVYSYGNSASFGSAPARLVSAPLISSAIPEVTGVRSIGETLTAGVVGWDKDATFSFQWFRNGEAIAGATTSKHFVTLVDLGSDLTVRVTGFKIGYRSAAQTSSVQKVSSSIPDSPCPGILDTSKPWLGTESQPRLVSLPSTLTAGLNFKGNHGKWAPATQFCVFWISNGHRIVPGANSLTYQSRFGDAGKSLQFVVVGTDKQGNQILRFSKPATLEPCFDSSVTVKSLNAVNGVARRISGSLKTCSPAKTVQYREKPFGQAWSSWKDYPTTDQHKFSISRTFRANSVYEVRVNNAGSWLYSGESEVNVRIKFALPLSFYPNSVRNSQGFNQGGNITIKFTGDKEFNGTCTVFSKIDYAFNFAGVAMGEESRFTQFTVKNGYGTGQVSMRWNGVAGVSAACEDPKFVGISDFRYATLRTNF